MTISKRIQDALKPKASSAEIESVLAAAREEADRLASLRDETRTKSLDPLANESAVNAARVALSDINFEADRLRVAAERLGEALEAAREREAEDERRRAYKAAQTERNKLTKELAEVYPEAAGRIAALLARVVKNNQAVDAANLDRPAGADHLKHVEHVVRGVTPNGMLERDGVASVQQVPHLVSTVALPHLDGKEAAHETTGIWGRGTRSEVISGKRKAS